jgi:hypothetical protein
VFYSILAEGDVRDAGLLSGRIDRRFPDTFVELLAGDVDGHGKQ